MDPTDADLTPVERLTQVAIFLARAILRLNLGKMPHPGLEGPQGPGKIPDKPRNRLAVAAPQSPHATTG